MRDLHPDVAKTATEVIIKESEGFRLRLEKWEAISPKGLFAIDLIQESLDDQGDLKLDTEFELVSLYCQSIIEGVFSIIHFGSLPEVQRWQKAEQLCEYSLKRLTII